jgi:hypothetical protein
MRREKHAQGFRILPFANRNGSTSYRVAGWLRGKRVRENFDTLLKAEARKHELDAERLSHRGQTIVLTHWKCRDRIAWPCRASYEWSSQEPSAMS